MAAWMQVTIEAPLAFSVATAAATVEGARSTRRLAEGEHTFQAARSKVWDRSAQFD